MINSNNRHILIAVALTALGATGARADLDINGAVGLPLNPTASLPAQGVTVQGDYHDLGTSGAGNWKDYSVHAAGLVGSNLEINGGIEHSRSSFTLAPLDKKAELALGVKYLFSNLTKNNSVHIAAGAGYSYILAKDEYAYVTGAIPLGSLIKGGLPATGHVGLRYDRYDFDVLNLGTSSKASGYLGLETPVSSNGDFSVAGELQSKNNSFGAAKFPFSAELRYQPIGQKFYISGGLARQGLTGKNGALLTVGYQFGSGTPAPAPQ